MTSSNGFFFSRILVAARFLGRLSYFTSYSDIDIEKVKEKVVINNEQIAYLFHIIQKFEKITFKSIIYNYI